MKNIAVIYGGMSTEHDVSIISGKNIIENLDKSKYKILPIIITKSGKWTLENGTEITNIEKTLEKVDVVFPVLHGLFGEDGTIQGMLKLLKVPCVGCGVLASSVCMDKVYSKIIFEKARIPQTKYVYLKNGNTVVDEYMDEYKLENDEVAEEVKEKLGFPVFIKPSNSGSSVGINKANNEGELIKGIAEALMYDSKILIEKAIIGKEVECAVIGNEDVEATTIGQILSAEEFYSFNAKYKNANSKTVIPANVTDDVIQKVKKLAIKAFKAVDGKGLARVDFFIENETNKIYINEINTMPGFTEISMYPKLWENEGISYSELLDKLVELAI